MKTRKYMLVTFCVTSLICETLAVNNDTPKRRIAATRTSEKIVVDGDLDESSWEDVPVVDGFWQHSPADSLPAGKATEVKVLYDDNYLYISALCFDMRQKPVVQTLARDADATFLLCDAFAVLIDPMNTGKTGYYFGVNAGGGEMDAFISQNGFLLQIDKYWSNKWYSSVGRAIGGVVYEIAIPFNTMQMDPDTKTWGVNFIRSDMEKDNLYYTWTKFEKRYDMRDLTHMGEITLDEVPRPRSGKFALIPSATAKASKDYTKDGTVTNQSKVGLDARLSLSQRSSANFMIMPDFSQVDVDRESLSFQDYEQYKPEQRIFFIENSDLFTSYGSSLYKHIYTRRMGILGSDLIPIWAGARATGTSSQGVRWGILDVQADNYEDEPSRNFFIATVNQQFRNKMETRLLITNIETFDKNGHQPDLFNRTAGLEFKYPLLKRKLNTNVTASKSLTRRNYSNSLQASASTKFMSKHIRQNNLLNIAQDNFDNPLGYYPRLYKPNDELDTTIHVGMTEINNKLEYWIYPSPSSPVSSFFPYIQHNSYILTSGKLDERFFIAGIQVNHRSSAFTSLSATYDDKTLLYPLLVVKGMKLMPPGNYRGYTCGFNHKTNTRSAISHEIDVQYGAYYLGTKYKIYNCTSVRIQPRLNVKVDYTLARVTFPGEYGKAYYHLVGAQFDLFFSRNHIWTTLFQINTQNSKMKVNCRYQWHYCPMSDFFIVFGEKFDEETKKPTSINLALKITYWLSM